MLDFRSPEVLSPALEVRKRKRYLQYTDELSSFATTVTSVPPRLVLSSVLD